MLIRPHSGRSSLAIRMLARKRLAGASRCAQGPFPSDFTTSSPELAIGLTPPRVDPLANPVLSPLLQTVRGAGSLPRLHRRGPIEVAVRGRCSWPASPLPRLHRRGPIEAISTAPPWEPCSQLFHGFIAVAPLKPPSGLGTGRPRSRLFHGFIAVAPLKLACVPCLTTCSLFLFHGFIAVAPLKHLYRHVFRHARVLFHGFIAVAPLKLDYSRERRATYSPLPRLHRRGPIEASVNLRCAFI